MAEKGIQGLLGKGTLALSKDGGANFVGAHKITNVSLERTPVTQNTVDYWDGPSDTSFGSVQPQDFNFDTSMHPKAQAYTMIEDALISESILQARLRTNSKLVNDNSESGQTLAIATTGVVTASSEVKLLTNPQWKINRVFVINNVAYVIQTITTETSMTVTRGDGEDISAAVTASSSWDLYQSGVEWLFEVRVLNAGNFSFTADGTIPTQTINMKALNADLRPTLHYTV